jgi:hypothetical protein
MYTIKGRMDMNTLENRNMVVKEYRRECDNDKAL